MAPSVPRIVAGPAEAGIAVGTLRERRKRELRNQLSEVATGMFLERGFDAVHVADVARACGVTEKTVFNHFRTKESLLVDRWDDLIVALCDRLADRAIPSVTAVLQVLDGELDELTSHGHATAEEMRRLVCFGQLLASTPALLAYRGREMQRLTSAILTALAPRHNTSEADPDTQITAEALTGLVTVFYRSLGRHAPALNAARCRTHVRRDARRAARRLTAGLAD